ncbi:MAG: AraC family transcriptional regulator [Bacteroidaceae bacterium]|nr:AraC family transcriptional regulator [Bacteroidaceae bacterium]
MDETRSLIETTPLTDSDCFYLMDRNKELFTYPLHKHEEMELNFVEHCEGARRTVGDSIEELGQYDLVLLGSGLEHNWSQYNCESHAIHEITIQFSRDMLGEHFLAKNQVAGIRAMLDNAKRGIAFDLPAIMRVYDKLTKITEAQPGFYRVLRLLEILYELSLTENYHLLASKSFANVKNTPENQRIRRVEEYIDANYTREIRLKTLSDMAGMTPAAFSRYFRTQTGRTISDYIIDLRLGHAARDLVDGRKSIAEICYECGFNNISNFNRIFKKKKGCAPSTFRDNYHKSKIII